MNAILPADIVADLEHAIAGCPPDRCLRMLWRTTDLLLGGRGRLHELEVAALDEVLTRLAERTEPAELARLSAMLADVTIAPQATVRQLAFHDDPDVAAPLLLKSQAISRPDLEAIAASSGEQQLLAIARRDRVEQNLTEILLRRGGTSVHIVLVKNPGALFSDAGYAILVSKAGRDSELEKALALRPGVPDAILHELLGTAKAAPAAAVNAAPSRTHAPSQRSACPAGTPPLRDLDYSAARPEIVALNRIGKLNDPTVNRFAVRGEKARLIVALSVLSGAPTEVIETMIADTDCEGLVMACRASRLNWQTTFSILNNRGSYLTQEERERAQQLFDSLHLSTSQWTVRWGELSARSSPTFTDKEFAKSGVVR